MKTNTTLGKILEENYPKYKAEWLDKGKTEWLDECKTEQEYDKMFIEVHEKVMRDIIRESNEPGIMGDADGWCIRIEEGKPTTYYRCWKDRQCKS